MERILAQCKKELLQFWRFPLTVALAFLLPFITLLIYGFAIRLEAKDIPLAVQDFDRSPLSRDYIDRFTASKQFTIINLRSFNHKTVFNSTEYIQSILDRGIAKVGMIIPPDFTRKIKENKTVDVQFLIDGTDVVNAKVIQNSIPAITNFFLVSNGLSSGNQKINPEIRVWFNPGRLESLFIVPGVFTIVLALFPAILAAIAMVREKEDGNIIQVYASSISAQEYILGKGLAYLLVALGETIFTVVLGMLIFGLGFAGNPIVFFIGTPIFLATNILYGLMVGAFTDSQRSAIQLVGTTQALTVILFSGFIYPVSNIPFPISLLVYVVPAMYYMEIMRDTFVRGSGFSGTWHLVLPIVLMGLLEFVVAWRKTRKMQL